MLVQTQLKHLSGGIGQGYSVSAKLHSTPAVKARWIITFNLKPFMTKIIFSSSIQLNLKKI